MKKTWKKLIFTALFSALLLENPALPLKEAVSLTAEAATPALSRSAFPPDQRQNADPAAKERLRHRQVDLLQ